MAYGGNKNIDPHGGKKFSKDYQPVNRRKSTKFLTELLTKNLKAKKEIEVEGVDVATGKKIKVKVPMPTKEVLIQALLRQAAKGNVVALKEVFDRVEGKVKQQMELTGEDGQPIKTENAQTIIYIPDNKRDRNEGE